MYTCGNCNTEFNGRLDDALIIEHCGKPATAICPSCTGGAKVVKIVLRRNPDGRFGYDQFTALEMQAKAFGKAG